MIVSIGKILHEIYSLWLDMGIYLVFGFAVAGILHQLIRRDLIVRHLGGNTVTAVAKASLFGIPLPLCSCGVVPVALSLFKRGASRGATTSFLISTPETGVDSILVTYGMLGPIFAIVRPVAAFFNGLLGGMAVVWTTPRDERKHPGGAGDVAEKAGGASGGSCCSSGDCHAGGREEDAPHVPFFTWRSLALAFQYGFVEFPRDIANWLVVGIVAAGVLSWAMPPNFLGEHLGGGFGAMVVMALAGIPMYICASASVPFVAVLVSQGGLSAGAALVFLMTGPATNAASLLLVARMLGRRTAACYLASIVFTSFLFGWLLDLYYALSGATLSATMQHAHRHGGMEPGFWKYFGGVALALIVLTSVSSNLAAVMRARRRPREITEMRAMLEIPVRGMTCANCVRHVTQAIQSVPGVEDVRVDLGAGAATVFGKELDAVKIAAAVRAAGYDA